MIEFDRYQEVESGKIDIELWANNEVKKLAVNRPEVADVYAHIQAEAAIGNFVSQAYDDPIESKLIRLVTQLHDIGKLVPEQWFQERGLQCTQSHHINGAVYVEEELKKIDHGEDEHFVDWLLYGILDHCDGYNQIKHQGLEDEFRALGKSEHYGGEYEATFYCDARIDFNGASVTKEIRAASILRRHAHNPSVIDTFDDWWQGIQRADAVVIPRLRRKGLLALQPYPNPEAVVHKAR